MAKTLNPDTIGSDALTKLVIGGEIVGYALDVSVTRYRNMPLSCIDEFLLKIDGEEIDPLNITFCINGKRFMIAQLKDLYAEYWDINDKARLEILKVSGIKEGEHEIDLRLIFRIPYIYANDTADITRADTENATFAKEDSSCSVKVTLKN